MRWRTRDWFAALALYAITAGVVLWQNARVAVLWDVSYILENATRISQGQLPYRDFPFPYAPLTFLTQAAIIKFFGRVYSHHIAYAAIAGGAATVLAWRIILRLLCGRVQHAWFSALLLAAPCCVLGVYCIFPHPFYDPDCTLVMLLAVAALLRIEDLEASVPISRFALIATGALLVLPVFIKQNIGLVFTFAILAALMLDAALAWRRGQHETAKRDGWIVGGAAMSALIAVALISVTVGFGNYVHWTVKFAASRRMPAWHEMLGVYTNPVLGVWLLCMLVGAVVALAVRKNLASGISVVLLTAPFSWAVIYLALDADVSERAERLLAVWPPVMVASFMITVIGWRLQRGLRRWIPLVLIATVHATFLSQQLWGSTYALWPVLLVLIACALSTFADHRSKATTPLMLVVPQAVAAVVGITLTIAGVFYMRSEERLSYVNVEDGALMHSSIPALSGVAMRGPYLPNFEELVRFSDRKIPRGDGIVMLPGEDLFYFTTGRTPQFPALMFDHTVNPYNSAEELVDAVRARTNIRWIVLKRALQLQEEPMPEQQRVLDLLEPEFELVEKLDNYDVYRRK